MVKVNKKGVKSVGRLQNKNKVSKQSFKPKNKFWFIVSVSALFIFFTFMLLFGFFFVLAL